MASIVASSIISKLDAPFPPKATLVAVVKFTPVIVITSPSFPSVGVKESTLGSCDTVIGVFGSYGLAPKSPSAHEVNILPDKHKIIKIDCAIVFIIMNLLSEKVI